MVSIANKVYDCIIDRRQKISGKFTIQISYIAIDVFY